MERSWDMSWRRCTQPHSHIIREPGPHHAAYRLKHHRRLITGQPEYNFILKLFPCVLLSREEEATECHGHITSLAVARTHRKLGIATRLMQAARKGTAWVCGLWPAKYHAAEFSGEGLRQRAACGCRRSDGTCVWRRICIAACTRYK